jgi:glutaredoxin-related protein
VQTNIKRELVKLKSNSQESKIVKYLQITNKFQNGKFITAKEAKETISKIYKELNVTKTANIKDYYEVKESQKRIDGEVTKGYIIIIPKLIVK